MSGIPGGRVVGAFGPQQGVCGKKMQYANNKKDGGMLIVKTVLCAFALAACIK